MLSDFSPLLYLGLLSRSERAFWLGCGNDDTLSCFVMLSTGLPEGNLCTIVTDHCGEERRWVLVVVCVCVHAHVYGGGNSHLQALICHLRGVEMYSKRRLGWIKIDWVKLTAVKMGRQYSGRLIWAYQLAELAKTDWHTHQVSGWKERRQMRRIWPLLVSQGGKIWREN